MKHYILIIAIAFFGHESITSLNITNKGRDYTDIQNSCPPYDEASGKTLLMFLTSDRYQENREKAGIRKIEEVNPEDVILSDDTGQSSICKKLRENFQWPRNHYSISYFKIDNKYFVVNALNVIQPEEEGKININSGNSFMIVLDEDLNRIGYFLY